MEGVKSNWNFLGDHLIIRHVRSYGSQILTKLQALLGITDWTKCQSLQFKD